MNVVKFALLGTAAFAAVSVSARADDLSDLKAQIESLNGRIAQLEATPAVPAGYQLMSVSETNTVILPGVEGDKFFGNTGTRIGILPTADVPASTNVVWTGYVSAAAVYNDRWVDNDADGVRDVGETEEHFDIMSKAGLNVTGTTDTAVGEVGVSITLLAEVNAVGGNNRGHDGSVGTDGFKGWWKITPELELSGGVFGSLASANHGWDAKCKCYYVGTDGGFSTVAGGDPAQIRLTYSSGPLTFAMAVEDSDEGILNDGNDGFGGAGELGYAGDMFGFTLNAGYWNTRGADNDWTVNLGANIGLGDLATLSVAAGMGEDLGTAGNADRYWKASAFTSFDVSDAVSLELGAGWKNYKGAGDFWGVGGGIYYTPVSQLTLGLEASHRAIKGVPDDTRAALVTVYRF